MHPLGAASKVNDVSNAQPHSTIYNKGPGGGTSLSRGGPPFPFPADASIFELQQRGTVFILCNNAYGIWMGLLAGGDASKAAELRKEFDANMLPGVYLVPAMVVAIDQAQKHGCSYIHV